MTDNLRRVWGIIIFALAVFIPFAAHAATIQGETSDTDVRSDGTLSATSNTTLVSAASGSPVFDRSSVLVFQLPNLGAIPNPFTSASLRFNLSAKTGTPPNIDIYGLGRRVSSAVLASDYYGATSTADPSDATLIQNNILISTTANGPIYTSSAAATALKNYLNTQYASGTGAGQYVFIRLSSDTASTTAKSYTITAANAATNGPRIIYNIPSGFTRPFIWVRDSEKADILAKIANNAWATTLYNGIVSRVASDVTSHQANRDTFLRALPIVNWAAATPVFKTIPAYSESSVRYVAEQKFNDAQDCAILFYLTGDAKYARCAGDILHNAIKTMLPVAASTSTGNGGWIFQDDLLKEARVTGPQLAIAYDFLHTWLLTNQVYDVKTAAMVNFNFTNAQSYFRRYYQLTRDHGQKESNWSALMATTMLNNLLALDDSTERNAAIQVYLNTGSSRQASLDYDYRNYTETGNIWPESLQYSGEVGDVRSTHLILMERVDPTLNLFDKYPNFPLSLPRISYLRYPSNNEQISFGDGHRSGGSQPYGSYELVYQHAKQRGRTDLTSFFGSLVNGGVADGKYNRSTLKSYSALSMRDEPLQLLWQTDSLSEPSVSPTLPRTDKLPFAGITLQRNLPASNSSTYGLMCFVGGAGHVHSHASGMSMEIFGLGEVMGAKSGAESYGTALHENHYRLFAANNTVIVNGASQGDGDWSNIAINKVQTVSMEPQAAATAVSPNYSFTCSSFVDDKGTAAEGTQQRTMAIVRTSPTTGYYVDVFRSKSTVSGQFHDYIYRNIGETAVDLSADGITLPLTSQPNRFQTDIGDTYDQPGWRYFTSTMVSAATSQSVKAKFLATLSGTDRYMSMHMPAVASREYAKVNSPAIVDAPSPYNSKVAPTLVVRQTGEAWNKAFATIYEPHFSSADTVQNVTQLIRSGVVVGVKVESTVAGKNLVQYILSNPASTETYTDSAIGLTFKGRFGIASNNGDGTTTLYLGEGSSLAYRGNSISTNSGSNSQAEARFTPGLPAVVTANTAVTTVVAPPPPNSTWIPIAAGSYDWNTTTNWNPATIPNSTGYLANQNTNLTGNQTVSLNAPATLGELVVGDSSGSETTTLQKGSAGSLIFDQSESANAYLTRTAGGTGTVTFASDLGISLTDNLTVRQTSGTSTILIAGTISGTAKGLTKDSSGLTLTLSGANTYTGETIITAGILNLANTLALQSSAINTTSSITGDATNGLKTALTTLTFGGLTGNKNLSSLFTTTGGYSSLTNLTLNPSTAENPSYSGIIANGAAGMTLTKTGLGTQTLTGSNTYTGSTILPASSGTLIIGNSGELGNGTYAAAISIGTGSTFDYASSSAQQLNGIISGTGLLRKSVSTSALTLGAANTSFTGTIALSNGTLILAHTNAISAATTLTLSSGTELKTSVQNATINAATSVSGTATIHAPDFGSGSTTSTLTMNGVISGSGNITFSSESNVASNSNQTIRLNASNTYTGTTTIHPAQADTNLILKLGTSNALPATTVLSINGVAGGGTGREADFDLNGFSQTIAGLQNTAASLRSQRITNSLGTTATLTFNNTTARNFTGTISGTNLSLVKNGTGTQTLAASNTYNGTTTLNAGKLQGVGGGHCSSSAFTLANAAATLGVSTTDNTKTWTCAALTTTAAGTIEFDYGTILPGSVKSLTVTGLAAFTATPTIRVVVNSSPAAGTYPLMSWGSTSSSPPTNLTVVKSNGSGGLADGTSATLSVSGNTLNFIVTVIPSFVKANNASALNTTTSWTGGIVPNATSTTKWNNTVTAANTTALGANATWGGITIDNPGGAVTISNTGGHTLTLGANAIDIGMSAANNNLTLNCPLILGDENDWFITTSRTLTLGGVVSGAFPITKQGAGTALLSAINTFTGDITLLDNSGILEISGSGKLGSGTFASTINIGTGSTFKYNSSAAQTLSALINGAGTFNKSGSGNLTLSAANPAFTGNLTHSSGIIILANTDALSAATSFNLSGSSILQTFLKDVTINAAITLSGTPVIHAPDFGTGSTTSTVVLNGAMSGSGNIVFSSAATTGSNAQQNIRLNAPSTYTGSTTLSPSDNDCNLIVKLGIDNALPATTVLSINGVAGGGSGRFSRFDLNSFSQTIAGLQNTAASGRSQQIQNSGNESVTLGINNSANFTYSGSLNGTNLSLDKAGTGTQTLSGSNAYTGITTVIEGILSLGNTLAMQNSALETSASITGDATNGLKTTVTTLTLGGLIGDKNLASIFTTTSGGYTGLTALTLNTPSGSNIDYSGIIANGAASMTLTKSGAGTQILSGSNTYTGATTLTAGTLTLGANNVLPTTAVTIGSAILDAASFTDTLGTLDLTSTATIHLGEDAALAFANSSAIDWTSGTLNITGTFVSGSSLRFGTSNTGLTSTQLASIIATGYNSFALNASGFLTANVINGYQTWSTANTGGQNANLDFDNDGVANGIEYILGGTSTTRDLAMLPTVTTTGGDFLFTFIRDQSSIDGTTTLIIETGENLTTWPVIHTVPDNAASNNPGVTVLKDTPVSGKDTVTLAIPLTSSATKFARLKILP